MKKCIPILLTTLLLVSCGKKDEDSAASSITISGAVSTASPLTAKSLVPKAIDLSALAMYCVAFNANATSDQSVFGDDGSFELQMPADTPFGCFVVQQSNLSIVATVTIEDNTQQDLSGNDVKSSSMSLGSNVSLGNLTLTEGSTELVVPISRIASSVSTKAPDITIDDLHNTSWTMSCLESDDEACAEFVNESPAVFFRIIKATKSSESVYGLGVWASQSAFIACGSADVETGGMSGAEAEGYSFTQLTEGTFSTGVSCPKRDDGDDAVSDNLQNYYTLQKLILSGNMFTLLDEHSETYSGGGGDCDFYEKLSVNFSPSGSSTLYGSFEQTEKQDGAGCEEDGKNETYSFKVKFTKQ